MNNSNQAPDICLGGMVFTKLLACDEVPDSKPKKVVVPGHPAVAVYRLDGEYFVTEDACTHGNGSLSMGKILEDGEIRCPVHRGSFDIRTGRAVAYPCTEPLMTFPVEVRDGFVYAALDSGSLPE